MAPVAKEATSTTEEAVSESDSEDANELRTLVGIELVRETQDEVVGLQVSLVQTQEQLQRALMELDRSIVAFEHSENKVQHLSHDKTALQRSTELLKKQVEEIENMYESDMQASIQLFDQNQSLKKMFGLTATVKLSGVELDAFDKEAQAAFASTIGAKVGVEASQITITSISDKGGDTAIAFKVSTASSPTAEQSSALSKYLQDNSPSGFKHHLNAKCAHITVKTIKVLAPITLITHPSAEEDAFIDAANQRQAELDDRGAAVAAKVEEANAAQHAAKELQAQAEQAMKAATNDEERAAAAELMKQAEDRQKEVSRMKADALHEQKMVLEAIAAQDAANEERAATQAIEKRKREAEERLKAKQRAIAEAEAAGTYSVEELTAMQAELADLETEAEAVKAAQQALQRDLEAAARQKQVELELKARELKEQAESALLNATTDEERAAARRLMEEALHHEDLAGEASKRVNEIQTVAKIHNKSAAEREKEGHSLGSIMRQRLTMLRALRTIGHDDEEGAQRSRLELFGLSKSEMDEEEHKLKEISALGRKEVGDFDDADTLPEMHELHDKADKNAGADPGTSKLKMRVKLAGLQSNTLSLLASNADKIPEDEEETNGGLLWTPDAMTITEGLELTGQRLKGMGKHSSMMKELIGEMDSLRTQISTLEGAHFLLLASLLFCTFVCLVC